jgi:AcrR family transcriptional regulator
MAQARRRARPSSVEKRQRILDAAAKILAKRGYSETTLQEVASECGMYAGSIYYYFDSRDDLVREVLAESLMRMHRNIEAMGEVLPKPVTDTERLQRIIKVLLDANIRRDDYAIAYNRNFDQIPEHIASEIKRERRRYRTDWDDILISGRDSGEFGEDTDAVLARFLILGAIHWVSRWYEPGGARKPEEITEAFTRMLTKAVK